MEKTDVLILGGSAAGLATANSVFARLPEKSIQIVRNVNYAVIPCGIPYIYGYLNSVEKNRLPDQGFLNKGMTFRQGHVMDVVRKAKTVVFEDGDSIQYEKLVLALGSTPKIPNIIGINLPNVFPVKKDPVYLQQIYEELNGNVKNIVVIGGGFIGVEVAEQFKMRSDYNVTIIEGQPHCLMNTCEEFEGVKVEEELNKMGVNIIANTTVKAINGTNRPEEVVLSNGQVLKADMVVLGIGADPNTILAQKIGLDFDAKLGIKVDEYMCTSDPDIFACGDCCTKFSAIDGTPSEVRLASVAALEGIITGSNLFYKQKRNKGVVGSFCTKVGGVSVASVGYTEKQCQERGIKYYMGSIVAPDRHPGSLPDCTLNMRMTMIFEKGTDRAIGAHIAGGITAGDMVNIAAVAIQNKLTADQVVATQFATHPLMTGSPLGYHVLWAAENAILSKEK